MSGRRCVGSSGGKGSRSIFEVEPVSSDHFLGQLHNRELSRITQVHGSGKVILGVCPSCAQSLPPGHPRSRRIACCPSP